MKDDYHRAAHDEAPLNVWLKLIAEYPDMKKWVVHDNTVPLKILAILADDFEELMPH